MIAAILSFLSAHSGELVALLICAAGFATVARTVWRYERTLEQTATPEAWEHGACLVRRRHRNTQRTIRP